MMMVDISRSKSARDFADRMGWVADTVYVNRRRSLAKLARGQALTPEDMPVGTFVEGQLRWTVSELERFAYARRRSRRRGGRPRIPLPRPLDQPAAGRRRSSP